MSGSRKLTKKQRKVADQEAQLTKLTRAPQLATLADLKKTPEEIAAIIKAGEDIFPTIDTSDPNESRVVKPSKAKSILFPTIFTMKPDNMICCGKCGGVDVVVVISLSPKTLKHRIYHSCGKCAQTPNYRIMLAPEHFNDRLSASVTSLLKSDSTAKEIEDQFASLFEKFGERMKKFTCKHHFNFCFHCKKEKPTNYCGGCFMARFCNDECNRAGWEKHKSMCKTHRGMLGKHYFVNF